MCMAVFALAAEADWGAALVDAVMAEQTSAARTAHLTRVLGERAADADAADRIGTAMSVLTLLDAQGIVDPDQVRAYLAPALHPSPGLRAEAATAARTLLPPPEVPEPEVAVDDITFGDEGGGAQALPDLTHQGEEVISESRTVYLSRALTRRETSPWSVTDGSGRTFSPVTFAERVGDWSGLERIDQRRVHGTAQSIGLMSGGALVIGTGISMATLGETSSDKTLAGATVAGVGAGIIGAGVGVLGLTLGRHRTLSRSYTAEEADQWIQEHNSALGDELLIDKSER